RLWRRVRGLRDRPGRGDRRVPSPDRRHRRRTRAGVRRSPRARRSPLVLGRLGPDSLRDRDGQLRHLERPARAGRGEARRRRHGPIVPKKFFHTSGNYREHEEESKNVGWSHEIAPWIVFFQNIDAIIGPEDPIVYPSHLTNELDYELELALVIRRSGKHLDKG